MISSAPSRDQFLHSGPLETLAGMTGGGSFRAEVNAEAAFDRLGRELSGYYRVGVEKDPSDLDGQGAAHEGAGVARRRDRAGARDLRRAHLRGSRLGRAPGVGARCAGPGDRLGLRVTSYLAADPGRRVAPQARDAGEASRLQPGRGDVPGRRARHGGKEESWPATSRSARPTGRVSCRSRRTSRVPPGSYIVRLAVMDGAGRVGSVDHRVEARDVRARGAVRDRARARARARPWRQRPARRARRRADRTNGWRSKSGSKATAAQVGVPEVVFEIAATADGPALVKLPAALSPGSREAR